MQNGGDVIRSKDDKTEIDTAHKNKKKEIDTALVYVLLCSYPGQ